jgi:hypothetical protein
MPSVPEGPIAGRRNRRQLVVAGPALSALSAALLGACGPSEARRRRD